MKAEVASPPLASPSAARAALAAENRALRQKLKQREAFDAIQKKKEEAAEASRATFRILLQSSPVVFYSREPFGEYGFTYVSDNLRAQLGYSPSVLMKSPKAWEARVHFEDAPRVRRALADELAVQGSLAVEYRLLGADGRYRWIRDHLRLVRNAEGRALEITGSWLDVTDRRRLEESLTDETARFRRIAETVSEIVWTRDGEGDIVAISPSVREVLGYEPEEFLAKRRRLWWKRVHPDDAAGLRSEIRKLAEKGLPYALDYRIHKSDETWITVREKGILRRTVNGTVLVEGTVVELAREQESALGAYLEERDRLQEALKRSEERFRLLFETMPGGVVVYEPRDGGRDFIIRDINRGVEAIEGMTRADILNRSVLEAFPGVVDFGLFEVLQRVSRTGQTEHHPARLYKDGRIEGWRENFVYRLATGEVVAVYRDVTARMRAEEEARASKERSERMLEAALESIASLSELSDPRARGHQARSARLAAALATEIGLPPATVEDIRFAAMLHDIGTVVLPPGFLDKPAKLTDEEFALLKDHTRRGAAIVRDAGFPPAIVQMVLQHHERLDGSGYPGEAKGEAISLEAMCLAVADVVVAMCADRAHRPALGLDRALEEIDRNRGRLYDARVADACLRLFREKGFTL